MNDHGVRMASSHWESLEEVLKSGRKVFQLLGCSLLQNPHLGISFKHFCSVGSRGDLSRKILTCGMSVHVKAFGPEGALRDIINLSLKGDISGPTVLSIKRGQFLWGKLFHFSFSNVGLIIRTPHSSIAQSQFINYSLFTARTPVK
jgi:hypothetical protein